MILVVHQIMMQIKQMGLGLGMMYIMFFTYLCNDFYPSTHKQNICIKNIILHINLQVTDVLQVIQVMGNMHMVEYLYVLFSMFEMHLVNLLIIIIHNNIKY